MNAAGCQSLATLNDQWTTSTTVFCFLHNVKRRKQPQHAGRYQCICRPSTALIFAHTDLSWGLTNQKHWRINPVSVWYFISASVCFLQDTNRKLYAKKNKKNNSLQFRFISWTSVNKLSTVSSPPTFRHFDWSRRERPKGRHSAVDWTHTQVKSTDETSE